MLKALWWKEFREVLPISVVALAAQILLMSIGVAQWRYYAQNQPGTGVNAAWGVLPLLYLISFLYVIGLGIWQNFRESTQNTYQFLLQRPVKRETIIGTKILSGLAGSLLIGLVPLTCYSLWCKSLGGSSRDGGDIVRFLGGLFTGILLVYLGAFASGLRPTRWYGSRFYPLFAALLVFGVSQSAFNSLVEHFELFELVGSYALTELNYVAVLIFSFGPLGAVAMALAALHIGMTRDYS